MLHHLNPADLAVHALLGEIVHQGVRHRVAVRTLHGHRIVVGVHTPDGDLAPLPVVALEAERRVDPDRRGRDRVHAVPIHDRVAEVEPGRKIGNRLWRVVLRRPREELSLRIVAQITLRDRRTHAGAQVHVLTRRIPHERDREGRRRVRGLRARPRIRRGRRRTGAARGRLGRGGGHRTALVVPADRGRRAATRTAARRRRGGGSRRGRRVRRGRRLVDAAGDGEESGKRECETESIRLHDILLKSTGTRRTHCVVSVDAYPVPV